MNTLEKIIYYMDLIRLFRDQLFEVDVVNIIRVINGKINKLSFLLN